jgi:glycosyltransferase involved in cell wall biosynthesis
VPIKGYDVLIAAFKEIAATIPNLVVLIVGEGEEKDKLQKQIEQSGLRGRVHLVGYYDRDTVLSIVKASDIFAMPSHYEGTPIALLEAAALARPILSTVAGGIPELVMNGESALLVPPGDAHALGAALAKLTTDTEYSQCLGANAQLRIQHYFDLDKQVEETWNAYRKAWGRHHASNY